MKVLENYDIIEDDDGKPKERLLWKKVFVKSKSNFEGRKKSFTSEKVFSFRLINQLTD